jgi:hypothetical protein
VFAVWQLQGPDVGAASYPGSQVLAAAAGAMRARDRLHDALYERCGKYHDRQDRCPCDCPGNKPVCDPRSAQWTHSRGGHGASDASRYGGLNDAKNKWRVSRGNDHIGGQPLPAWLQRLRIKHSEVRWHSMTTFYTVKIEHSRRYLSRNSMTSIRHRPFA